MACFRDVLEESNFNFQNVRQCDLDIDKEKLLTICV